MVGSPFAPFVQDHFHVPGAMFRPLSYASMWLNQRFLGNGYTSHAAVELGLHVGVSLALYALVHRSVRSPAIALLCTLLFAAHPAVVGAAIWYSDRSGHLAALFMLVALNLGYCYRDNPRMPMLALVVGASFAAMLSKDHGVAIVVPLTLLWLSGMSCARAPMLRAIVWLWALVPAYFAWRHAVLGTAGSTLVGAEPIWQTTLRGLRIWLANLPGYATYWEHLDAARRGVLILAAALVGVALAASVRDVMRGVQSALLVSGIVLFAVPAMLQAPIAAFNASPLAANMTAVEAAMQARIYYLSLAGLVLTLSVLLGAAWDAQQAVPRRKTALAAGLAVSAAVVGHAGWCNVEAYRARALEIDGVARAALDVLEHRPLPAANCRIYFLDVWHSEEWGIYASMDSIVKALEPRLDRVAHCLIRSDYPTFFHYLPAGVFAAEGWDRLAPAIGPDGPLRPRRVGDAEIVYLAHPSPPGEEDLRSTLFLAWENGRFHDVSAEVRSGERQIRYR
jgi:hypothetical protein